MLLWWAGSDITYSKAFYWSIVLCVSAGQHHLTGVFQHFRRNILTFPRRINRFLQVSTSMLFCENVPTFLRESTILYGVCMVLWHENKLTSLNKLLQLQINFNTLKKTNFCATFKALKCGWKSSSLLSCQSDFVPHSGGEEVMLWGQHGGHRAGDASSQRKNMYICFKTELFTVSNKESRVSCTVNIVLSQVALNAPHVTLSAGHIKSNVVATSHKTWGARIRISKNKITIIPQNMWTDPQHTSNTHPTTSRKWPLTWAWCAGEPLEADRDEGRWSAAGISLNKQTHENIQIQERQVKRSSGINSKHPFTCIWIGDTDVCESSTEHLNVRLTPAQQVCSTSCTNTLTFQMFAVNTKRCSRFLLLTSSGRTIHVQRLTVPAGSADWCVCWLVDYGFLLQQSSFKSSGMFDRFIKSSAE